MTERLQRRNLPERNPEAACPECGIWDGIDEAQLKRRRMIECNHCGWRGYIDGTEGKRLRPQVGSPPIE